jgi:hypothetical protein|tara:strand:- start:322 stop:711 length:390 start_codon:yes stop_codon:yes gene_type:complete
MSIATQRTIKALRKEGALCAIVEKFNVYGGELQFQTIQGKRMGKRTGVRIDLFGIIDIIALIPGREKVCGVQSCGTAYAEHKKKILNSAYAPIWLRYADLELWGWRPLKKEGKKLWTPRIHKFSLADWL